MKKLASGVVHAIPKDLEQALRKDAVALQVWEDITPLARNEWICWVTDAKQEKTRTKRIRVGISQMNEGKRRPCCWPGCKHRTKKP